MAGFQVSMYGRFWVSTEDDVLAEQIHLANCEHAEPEEQLGPLTDDVLESVGLLEPEYPQRGGPDLIDEGSMWFTTGFLNARKDG